jgi:hypothetical protein
VPTIPALVDDRGLAVDARPLIELGLLEISELGRCEGHGSSAAGGTLFDALADDRTYALLLHRLGVVADAVAHAVAADLDEVVGEVRHALDVALGHWQVALWRLADEPLRFAQADAAGAVLAPVSGAPTLADP